MEKNKGKFQNGKKMKGNFSKWKKRKGNFQNELLESVMFNGSVPFVFPDEHFLIVVDVSYINQSLAKGARYNFMEKNIHQMISVLLTYIFTII